MSQGALLFEMTIRDNILIGLSDEEAASIDITRLCKISNLDWDLQRTEQGLDQEAGFQGKMLSTGMAQRVLLARTIVRNRPVLLLDEPCSAQESDAVRVRTGVDPSNQGGDVLYRYLGQCTSR